MFFDHHARQLDAYIWINLNLGCVSRVSEICESKYFARAKTTGRPITSSHPATPSETLASMFQYWKHVCVYRSLSAYLSFSQSLTFERKDGLLAGRICLIQTVESIWVSNVRFEEKMTTSMLTAPCKFIAFVLERNDAKTSLKPGVVRWSSSRHLPPNGRNFVTYGSSIYYI